MTRTSGVDIVQLGDLSPDQLQSLRQVMVDEGLHNKARSIVDANDPDGIALIAVADGDVAGMIEGKLDTCWWSDNEEPGHVSPYAFVTMIVVGSKQRRRGVGRKLLLEFARRSADAGCTWLEGQEHWRADGGRRAAFFAAAGLRRTSKWRSHRIVGAEIRALLDQP